MLYDNILMFDRTAAITDTTQGISEFKDSQLLIKQLIDAWIPG